jgi:hypothetical protein
MIYVIIAVGLLFVSMGFLVTERNSKYLLSGYNTMSETEQKQFDIGGYIPYFRKFHIFLGVSFGVLGLLLYFLNENASGVFLGVYPLAAYIYFVWKSTKFSKEGSTIINKVGIVVLTVVLSGVIVLFVFGFKEDNLILHQQKIELTGSYGEVLLNSEIKSVELVNELPQITLRTNGFSLGTINKGYYKTRDGEIVKLILNANAKPIILFTRNNGEKIYFSARSKSNEVIFSEIMEALP